MFEHGGREADGSSVCNVLFVYAKSLQVYDGHGFQCFALGSLSYFHMDCLFKTLKTESDGTQFIFVPSSIQEESKFQTLGLGFRGEMYLLIDVFGCLAIWCGLHE